jgi:hypothetical protein
MPAAVIKLTGWQLMIGKGKTAPKAKNHGSKKTALCKPFCKKETGLSCRSFHDPHDGL